MNDVDELVGGLGARLTGARSARHEVLPDAASSCMIRPQ
jgi:hypothetical protein